jgi:hypothetical protein
MHIDSLDAIFWITLLFRAEILNQVSVIIGEPYKRFKNLDRFGIDFRELWLICRAKSEKSR